GRAAYCAPASVEGQRSILVAADATGCASLDPSVAGRNVPGCVSCFCFHGSASRGGFGISSRVGSFLWLRPSRRRVFHATRDKIIWMAIHRQCLRSLLCHYEELDGVSLQPALAHGLFLRRAALGLRRVSVFDRETK